MRHVWHPGERVEAVAFDTPIVGWRGRHVNTLRLWSARAPDPLKLDAFNAGDYIGALSETVRAESISKVLYPSDATPAGQELRLRQEYFFASASLLDLVRRHVKQFKDVRTLGDHVAVQLNDTHPAISVAELMRILVDLNGLPWEEAWEITRAVFSYTNHTLLPEALESWPVGADGAAAAAPHADHLSHQRHASRRRAQERPDRFRLHGVDLADRRARRPPRAHGRARLRRLAQDQRRLGAAHQSDETDGVPRSQHRLSRPHRQQDQRHHVPALADGVQSAADRASSARRSAKRRCIDAEALRGLRQVRRRFLDAGADRAGAPRQQGHARRSWSAETAQPAARPRRDVRRADQAHPRIQAAVAQHPRDHRALQRDPRQSDDRFRAAREDLRRQGGGELHPGQAHHQARHRRRARGQLRSDRARAAQGGVPAELQRQPGRDDHPRRRSLRADFHRRHGGLGNRQHEDGVEWGVDGRHARRRQCRACAIWWGTRTSSSSA